MKIKIYLTVLSEEEDNLPQFWSGCPKQMRQCPSPPPPPGAAEHKTSTVTSAIHQHQFSISSSVLLCSPTRHPSSTTFLLPFTVRLHYVLQFFRLFVSIDVFRSIHFIEGVLGLFFGLDLLSVFSCVLFFFVIFLFFVGVVFGTEFKISLIFASS